MSEILEILGCEHPLTIGAMAHIGTSDLGIPVIQAGFGFCMTMIKANTDRDEWVTNEVNKLKKASDSNFGLNILMADNPRIKEDVELIIKMKPRFVTLSAVLRPPTSNIKALHDAGIYVGILVGSARFTQLCIKVLGKDGIKPDFLIAEGNNSGGHLGPEDTDTLLKEVIPVAKKHNIAIGIAGGISDFSKASNAFSAGADFIQIGSWAAVSKESPAHPDYKERVFKSSETIVTAARFRHPVRALKSPFTEKLHAMENDSNMNWERFSEFARGSVPRGLLNGDWETGTMLCGTCCKDIKSEKSITEIGNSLISGNSN